MYRDDSVLTSSPNSRPRFDRGLRHVPANIELLLPRRLKNSNGDGFDAVPDPASWRPHGILRVPTSSTVDSRSYHRSQRAAMHGRMAAEVSAALEGTKQIIRWEARRRLQSRSDRAVRNIGLYLAHAHTRDVTLRSVIPFQNRRRAKKGRDMLVDGGGKEGHQTEDM